MMMTKASKIINHDYDDDDNLSNFCEREETIAVDINCFPKLLASLVVLLDIEFMMMMMRVLAYGNMILSLIML